MTLTRKNTRAKASLIVAGGLTLLALTGCASNEPEGQNYPVVESPSSSLTETVSDHLDVAAAFEAPSGWTVIKESDRTKPDGTEVHNIRWDTGDLVTVKEIRSLFDEHGYTVDSCYEQIINCIGTAPIEGGTVKVSISGQAWTDSKTGEAAGNEVFMDVSSNG